MKITLREQPTFFLYLGREGENKVKTFEFDFTDFAERFGAGDLSLIVKRQTDIEPYPVALDVQGNLATWIVSNVDTSVVGQGEAQLIYTVEDKVKKTVILKTIVDPSLSPSSEEVPEPYNDWIEGLAQIGGQIVTNKTTALGEISTAQAKAIDAISSNKDAALDDISESKADAVQTLRGVKDESLQAISLSKAGALQDIEAEGIRVVDVMDEKVTSASQSADTAAESAGLAQDYSEQAELSARRAQSYAENLHFIDDGDGNISIRIGG